MTKYIFVFGSNLAGRHGAGSAKKAAQSHGAIYGQGIGLQGNSYAIPTKDEHLHSMSLPEIKEHVKEFLEFAAMSLDLHPDWKFDIVKIGCGLAGYKEEQIAPMFKGAPNNCILPLGWRS